MWGPSLPWPRTDSRLSEQAESAESPGLVSLLHHLIVLAGVASVESLGNLVPGLVGGGGGGQAEESQQGEPAGQPGHHHQTGASCCQARHPPPASGGPARLWFYLQTSGQWTVTESNTVQGERKGVGRQSLILQRRPSASLQSLCTLYHSTSYLVSQQPFHSDPPLFSFCIFPFLYIT